MTSLSALSVRHRYRNLTQIGITVVCLSLNSIPSPVKLDAVSPTACQPLRTQRSCFAGQTDKFIFILQLQALKKTLKRKKNSRFKVNMQLKLIYLQYEEAAKGREVFESNDYLLFAFMSGMMLTFNSRCSSNKIATSFNM